MQVLIEPGRQCDRSNYKHEKNNALNCVLHVDSLFYKRKLQLTLKSFISYILK